MTTIGTDQVVPMMSVWIPQEVNSKTQLMCRELGELLKSMTEREEKEAGLGREAEVQHRLCKD